MSQITALICTYALTRFTCLWRRCFLAGRGGGGGEGLRKVTMSSGQCTEGGLELGREHAVKEEEGMEEDSGQEESFDKEKKRENQKIRMPEEGRLIG